MKDDFRKAEEAMEGDVTDARYFAEEISPSRNATPHDRDDRIIDQPRRKTKKHDDEPRPPATRCAWCEAEFERGQTRFPIIIEWFGGYFPSGFRMRAVVASLCGLCFKDAPEYAGEGSGVISYSGELLQRVSKVCAGCGEPIWTLENPRCQHWLYCSNRCYQRDYRKRRRGRCSVVAWKAHRANSACAVCKKPLDRWGQQHKRKDAVYCSSKCRQWAYRRRKDQL